MIQEKTFEDWLHDMWEEYCNERSASGNDCMPFNEYIKKNNAYLRMQYDAQKDPLFVD